MNTVLLVLALALFATLWWRERTKGKKTYRELARAEISRHHMAALLEYGPEASIAGAFLKSPRGMVVYKIYAFGATAEDAEATLNSRIGPWPRNQVESVGSRPAKHGNWAHNTFGYSHDLAYMYRSDGSF